jgi:hypothetical protein
VTYELLLYCSLCILTILSVILGHLISFRFFCAVIIILYSIVVRYSGFDIDMIIYASAIESDSYSIYYLKEPVYWLSSRILFDLYDSPELVFITFDLFILFICYSAFNRLRLPFYAFLLFVVFFPTLMGMQNIYRQFIATGFLISSFSFAYVGEKRKSIFVFLLAGFTQNVAFMFLPVIISLFGKRYKILSISSALVIFILLPLAAMTKSSSSSNGVGIELYLFFVTILSFFHYLSLPRKFTEGISEFSKSIVFMFILTFVCAIFLGEAQSKRVAMMTLIFLLIPSIMAIESRYDKKYILVTSFILLACLPTFLSSSTLDMLKTTLLDM